MKLTRKIFPSIRELFKIRQYKKDFLAEITNINSIEGETKKEKLQHLFEQKEYHRLLMINSFESSTESPLIKEAAKKIYNIRESNPHMIAKRWFYLHNLRSEKRRFIIYSGMFLLFYYMYANRDVFFDEEDNGLHEQPLKMVEGNQPKPKKLSRDWYQKLKSRILEREKKAEVVSPIKISERLDDVKGINEVRAELEEVVKILKEPKKYEDAGAKLMKGMLLVGKPGTGKTLLARALAGESGVNFLYTTASEFEHKVVGVGSKKLKKLFQRARENSPCIIFIDEIDSLINKGKRKGKHSTSFDRSDVNTFLAEMDGFQKNEHVFILGATNSLDSLDEAALRPGRFDKIITVPLPDKTGRNEIFTLFLKKIKLRVESDICSTKLSEMTPGFSGAEIENMVNLATILAVDKQKSFVNRSIFEEARDRIIMGIKLKSNKNLRYMLQKAVHEAGHTLVCYKNSLCRQDIHKVSIAKRGFSEGKTSILPDENFSGTKEEFITYIQVSLAGILAEEIYFGNNKISTGCGSDLSKASSLARDMVTKYAMNSKDFGYMYIDEGYVVDHKISNETRNLRDHSVDTIIAQAQNEAKEILKANLGDLKSLTQHLLEYDELSKEEIEKILTGKKLDKCKEKTKTKIRSVDIDNISL